jgi:hypothetical protein
MVAKHAGARAGLSLQSASGTHIWPVGVTNFEVHAEGMSRAQFDQLCNCKVKTMSHFLFFFQGERVATPHDSCVKQRAKHDKHANVRARQLIRTFKTFRAGQLRALDRGESN